MSRANSGLKRLVDVVFHAVVAWAALGVLVMALSWNPDNAFLFSGKIFALLITALATAYGVMGAFWAVGRRPEREQLSVN